MAPIILTLFAALKTKLDMTLTSPLLLPEFDKITFDNFKKVLTDKYLLIGSKNTGIILIVSLFFNAMFGVMTAFIIERFEFKGKQIVIAFQVCGIDSWGADVESQYHIDAQRDICYSFVVSII